MRGTDCDVSIVFYNALASLSRSGVGLAGPALAPLAGGGDKKFQTEPLVPLAGAHFRGAVVGTKRSKQSLWHR